MKIHKVNELSINELKTINGGDNVILDWLRERIFGKPHNPRPNPGGDVGCIGVK